MTTKTTDNQLNLLAACGQGSVRSGLLTFTWIGKNYVVPSLHRDNFLAKVPGPNPVRRQVTPTNFIAGPLAISSPSPG